MTRRFVVRSISAAGSLLSTLAASNFSVPARLAQLRLVVLTEKQPNKGDGISL